MNKQIFFLLLLALSLSTPLLAKDKLEVSSPDTYLTIKISANDKILYSVIYKGVEIITPSAISLVLENKILGASPKITKTTVRHQQGKIVLPYGNSKTLEENYNELEIEFADNFILILRAYNEGVAYRFKTKIDSEIKIMREEATFTLQGNPSVIYPETDVLTSWEVPYVEYPSVSQIAENKAALTPTLFSYKGGVRVVIAESDVVDYPGMYVRKSGGVINGSWANYPKRTELGSWGNFVSVVKERTDFIAQTDGNRTFPWRVIIATDDDKSLLTNKLIYMLAKPSVLKDVSWIKPGKAAWEWWHDAIIQDAEIPSGMENRNTALYKHYIDFAADTNLEYLMIDAGWSNIFDLSKVNTKVDVQEIIRYGKSKNVGVFLWCVATTLVADLDRSMDLVQQWGAVGLKVDFIDRDDQLAIRWFEDIAKAAAQRKLMVDFHGCSKPTGVERTYPNIINYEAVRGAECSKWDLTANPDHHLLIPFIRMLAGPMDYTPGSMRNKTRSLFKPIDPGLPSTQGTRCHELAMYIVYDQPFAMLCDSPAEYRKFADILQYLSAVPTDFDETKTLDAKLGKYAVVAKRKGDQWFVGAMSSWEQKTIDLDFSFLPSGKTYQAEIYTDGKEAAVDAEKYDHKTITVDRRSKVKVELAQGGGAVVFLHP